MSDHVIVLSRDDTAAFMAAVADLEQEQGDASPRVVEATETLSRIASVIDGQASAQ